MGDSKPSSLAPLALAILRIASAILFIPSGTMKLFGWPAKPPHEVALLSQDGIGGIIETVGGLLLLLGFYTRPTAFILSGTMAVAYWQFHAVNGHWFFPMLNGGLSAALFCFVFLYLAAAGPGAFALDGRRPSMPAK